MWPTHVSCGSKELGEVGAWQIYLHLLSKTSFDRFWQDTGFFSASECREVRVSQRLEKLVVVIMMPFFLPIPVATSSSVAGEGEDWLAERLIQLPPKVFSQEHLPPVHYKQDLCRIKMLKFLVFLHHRTGVWRTSPVCVSFCQWKFLGKMRPSWRMFHSASQEAGWGQAGEHLMCQVATLCLLITLFTVRL